MKRIAPLRRLLWALPFAAGLASPVAAASWTPSSTSASTPLVWLDAADASTLTMDPSNPGHVLGWRDKGSQGDNASTDSAHAPTLATLNGLTAVDFGPFVWQPGLGANMSMAFASPVATVFIVWGSANGGNFLLTSGGSYPFHRSQPGTGTQASDPIFDATVPWSDASLRSGDADTRLNGTLVDPTATGLSGGWDIVATRVSSGNTLPFDTLANDRGIRSGAQGIAELLTFGGRLSVAEVQRIEGYLAWKWGLQGKLASTHPYKSHAPVVGPIAQYHLDETAYTGAAGEVRDSSGNGLNGVAIGNPLPVPQASLPAIAGTPGTCGNVLFQGAANGGASLAFTGLPVHTEGGAQTSVSFWMYWDGRDYALPIGWNQYNLWLTGGVLVFNTNGQGLYGISSAGLANGWHHIVGVFTNGNYTANHLYVDGVDQALTVWQPLNDSISYVSSSFNISGWPINPDVRYGGRLDEVQVFDGALIPSEVDALRAQTHACPVAPAAVLVAEYRLEENSWTGAAGELLDASGNGHTGRAIGSVLPTPSTSNPARAGNPGSCHYAALGGPTTGGAAFQIDGLPVSAVAGDRTSVSFWMYWDGTDGVMPIGWTNYDLYIWGGRIGFNSFTADQWGISSGSLANGWHHIAAVFVNGNLGLSELYLDGVSQTLSQYNTINNANAYVSSSFFIGANGRQPDFRFKGALDEVRIYANGLTQADVTAAVTAGHPCGVLPSSVGGFNAFESATSAGAVNGVIHTKVAGASFTIDAVAIGADHASVLTGFYGDVKIELLDASDNSGALDAASQCRSSWQAIGGNPGATLTFAAADAGRKAVGLGDANVWRDARVRLSWPATGAPSTVACSSDDFAIRPAAFAALTTTDADSASAGSARSLDNVGASGGTVHKAGQPFTIAATAVNAASATTSGYTGTPAAALSACSGSACSPPAWTWLANEGQSFTFAGTRTVRYGNSNGWTTQAITGGAACTNAVFGDPTPGIGKECDVAGAVGVLTFTPVNSGGVIGAGASYSEAGSIGLQLVDASFAAVDAADGSSAAELTIASPTVNLGRFVPDHFELVSLGAPTLRTFDSSSCTTRSFTYVGQPFGYASTPQASVIARNAAGATTTLYANSLWKLGAAGVTQVYAPTPASPGLDTSAIGAATLISNGDGTGLLVGAATDKLAFVRPAGAPLAPFTASIALSWSATDASEAAVGGNGSITTPVPLVFGNIAFDAGNRMRFGVLRMLPAYGSELVNLPVQLEAQYWDGTRFATNAADQCTSVPVNSVAMGNYQRSLAACKTALGSGSVRLASGRSRLVLARPGNGNTGSVDLALQLGATAAGPTCGSVGGATSATVAAGLPWLQGRWGSAASFDQNPSTRASFGAYRSPLIFQREVY